MKRTLTLKYVTQSDGQWRSISKQYDIEDYTMTEEDLEFVEEEMIDLIPPDTLIDEFIWDSYPAPKGSGENPPEDSWIEINGRRWATDGIMFISEDQPVRIPALRRWIEADKVRGFRHIFTDSIAAKIPHPGYFDNCFKVFNSPSYKVLSVVLDLESALLSTGYVFEVSSNRLVAVIMPIDARQHPEATSLLRFGATEAAERLYNFRLELIDDSI